MLIAIGDFITQVPHWLSAHWQPLVIACLALTIFRLLCLNRRKKKQIKEFERNEKNLRKLIADGEHENLRLRKQCSIHSQVTEQKMTGMDLLVEELVNASHLPYHGNDDSG